MARMTKRGPMKPFAPPLIAPEPMAMRTTGWADYALIDSGDGRKLERYGPYRVIRPEAQCLWTPGLDPATWASADVRTRGSS